MYPVSSSWLSYVPYHVARDLLENSTSSPIGREQRFEAVALFADVSGFTAISEALGKTGRQGTEELTTILNSYFEPMIALIVSYGGIIGKFGGDALTVLFPIADLATNPAKNTNSITNSKADKAKDLNLKSQIVSRAIQCALEMQANMHRYAAIPTSAGTYNLAMKAGLALGTVFCTSVGTSEPPEAARLEYLIAGHLLDLCAEAEHHATKGEVVIHNDLLQYAGALEIAEERGDFSCVAALKEVVEPMPLPPLPLEQVIPAHMTQLALYLHPSLAQRLSTDQSSFINEHRKVTVLFASFSGFDYDHDPLVGSKLQTYLSEVIAIIQKYDGYLNKVDMGDKGSKYIVLFGAPVAHENDEERALLCALELLQLSAAFIPQPSNQAATPKLQIGINTGFVYCGQVGSTIRQEYTVMGDAVNLAARMMQAAKPGQIMVSGFTRRYVPNGFKWQDFAPVQVKGKSEPVAIYGLLDIATTTTIHLQQPTYNLPMVGREKELEAISNKLLAAKAGRSQIVAITAEAGIGKSRLVAEVIRLANQENLTIYGGECQSYGTNSSYLVWHNIWRAFFSLAPDWDTTSQIAYLQQQLAAIDENLVQRMPLLAVVLNLPIPENSLTQSLDPKLRKASLEALLVTCLCHRAKLAPLMLVLEDCHWIDALSYDLLEAISLALNDVPVLIVLAYRPPEPGKERFDKLAKQTSFYWREFRLQDFTRQEAERLIALKMRQLFGWQSEKENVSVPMAALVKRVTERSQGNPFYIEEIINLIQDKGINPQDSAALEQLELPDSLYSLIISRIDQLSESEKIVVKVASVIGRAFRLAWLIGVQPQLGTAEQVKPQLDNLSRLDITPLDKPEPEFEYLFKHIITKDVAYESLAFATRQHLHEQTGLFIEQTYVSTINNYLDLLAFHYGHSTNQAKQRQYFELAADAAATNYANENALEYYHRLLPLLPDDEKLTVLLKQGEILRLIGKMAEAETVFREALQLAENSRVASALARSQNALGKFFWYRSQYDEAMTLLEQARQSFQDLHDEAGLSQAIGDKGLIYWRQGNYPRALECYDYQLQTATRLNNQKSVMKALWNTGIVFAEQNDFSQARHYFERQLQVAKQSDNRQGIGEAVGSLAITYAKQGESVRALHYFIQQLQIATEIGDRRNISLAIGNIGEVHILNGNYEAALICYQQKLQIACDLSDQTAISIAALNIARVHAAQADYQAAEKMVNQAIELGQKVPYHLCDCFQFKAELFFQIKRYQEAQIFNEEALKLANQKNNTEIEFKAQILSIRLQFALKKSDYSSIVVEFKKLLANKTSEEEQAALYYELWRVSYGSEQADKYCQCASNLYQKLANKAPNIAEHRNRYQELNSSSDLQVFAVVPLLPPLPELVRRSSVNVATLLLQLDKSVAKLLD